MPIHFDKIDENKIILALEGAKGNSFGPDILQELLDQFDKISDDDSIKGIVITGMGRAFSVGGNVFAMYEAIEGGNARTYLDAVVPLIEKVVTTILQYPKPVIAAVNGAAAGGGLSLALACDEIVCVQGAKFGMAFGGLALSPDSGSSVLYADHFGRKTAIHGIATAQVFTAMEVQDRGIATIIDADNLLKEAAKRVDAKVAKSAYSYAKTKLLVNQNMVNQLKHNLPMEYETIKEASLRQEFEDKVRQTVGLLTKKD